MNEIERTFLNKGLKGMNLYESNRLMEYYMDFYKKKSSEINAVFLLEKLKSLKLEKLRLDCEDDIESGFTASNGHFYRTNRDDQLNMIGQKDWLNDFPDEEVVYWKTEDAGYISHTRQEWISVYNEGYVIKRDKLFKLDQLRRVVLRATTSEEVVSIKWHSEVSS